MPFNSGVFSRVYNWVTDKNNSINITASRMDTEMDGMATALSTCLLKDGSQTVTANIPMSSHKFTGLSNGSASTDSATVGQVQTGFIWCGTSGGTANAQTLTPSPIITAYAAAQGFEFLPVATNTSGTVTIANSGLATRAVKKSIGGALVVLAVGDIIINIPAKVLDDGTQYVLMNPQTYTHGADIASASTVNLDTATGDLVDVTGTTTWTAITLSEGRQCTVRHTGAQLLTNGASLVLLSAANITTAAGDISVFRGYASGVVRQVSFQRLNGTPVGGASYKVLTGTYDISTTGALAITGAGFTPKSIEIKMAINASKAWSIGTSDGTTHACFAADDNDTVNTVVVSTTQCSTLIPSAGTQALTLVASFDADGLTLTKSKIGSPTGTGTYIITCKR